MDIRANAPYLVIYLHQTFVFEWHVFLLQLQDVITKRNMLKKIEHSRSKNDNHSRLNSQYNW